MSSEKEANALKCWVISWTSKHPNSYALAAPCGSSYHCSFSSLIFLLCPLGTHSHDYLSYTIKYFTKWFFHLVSLIYMKHCISKLSLFFLFWHLLFSWYIVPHYLPFINLVSCVTFLRLVCQSIDRVKRKTMDIKEVRP